MSKPELTGDEVTVLMIAAQGEPMMPIGRWEKPTESLVAKGYLRTHPCAQDPSGRFNCRITDAGRQALGREEAETDQALATVINKSRGLGNTQRQMLDEITTAAQAINRAAAIAQQSNGGTFDFARGNVLSLLRQRLEQLDNERYKS